MRLAFAAAALICLAGCGERVTDVYTFEPGQFDPDMVPGIERLDSEAAQGDPDAQFQVAFYRHFMTGDYASAIPVFQRLAVDGHLDSVSMLAGAYRDGKGVDVDYERAAYWLERAAALGDERAARDLAAYREHRGELGG